MSGMVGPPNLGIPGIPGMPGILRSGRPGARGLNISTGLTLVLEVFAVRGLERDWPPEGWSGAGVPGGRSAGDIG